MIEEYLVPSLNRLYRLARQLEQNWANDVPKEIIESMKLEISTLKSSQNPFVSKISQYESNLRTSITKQQLQNFIVPVERALNRSVKDHEFLVIDKDRTSSAQQSSPLKVILHNVRSAFNVGSIFRMADALGVREVCLSGYTATPQTEKIKKTAMGAEDHVQWSSFESLPEAISYLKKLDYQIVALETATHATSVFQFQFPEKTALLFGNERFGIEANELSLCESVVQIPTYGVKNSLNVASCFGIVGYQWRQQWSN